MSGSPVAEPPPRLASNRVNVRIGAVGFMLLAASCWLFVRASFRADDGQSLLALISMVASVVPTSGYLLGYTLPHRRLIGWRVPAILFACVAALALGSAAGDERL